MALILQTADVYKDDRDSHTKKVMNTAANNLKMTTQPSICSR